MKKGLSSLVVTLLLVAFVIVIAALIMHFQTGLVKNLQENSGDVEKICSSEVKLEVLEGCYNQENVIITIQNKGKRDITSDTLFRLYGEETCISLPEPLEEIKTFESKQLILTNNCGKLNKIEIIPNIEIEGKREFCNTQITSFNIASC